MSLVLLWQIRVGVRLLCWLATTVGGPMVALATAFKACQRASASLGLLVIPVQLALLLVWAPTRLLFIALLSAAESAYRTDTYLRDRLAARTIG